MKQRKLSKNSTRTTALLILKNNLNRCANEESLNNLQRVRQIYSIMNRHRKIVIPINKKNHYIKLKHYIDYFKAIPLDFYSDRPIFYYNKFKWDALGLLGERIHRSNLRSKYLELCFAELNINICRVLDNELKIFYKYTNNKKRIIGAIEYINENLTQQQLKRILTRSIKLSDERTIIFEQPGRSLD